MVDDDDGDDDGDGDDGDGALTRLGDEQTDSRLLFNLGDLGFTGSIGILQQTKAVESFKFEKKQLIFLPGILPPIPLLLGGDIVVDAVDHLLQLLVLLQVPQWPLHVCAPDYESTLRRLLSSFSLSKLPRHLIF